MQIFQIIPKNMKQYKNNSALALLQMHHQYSIFNPGDWVLDIGAGPQFTWTDLAIKLTNDDQETNQVISNDLQSQGEARLRNIFVRGNFSLEQIQTKIGMNLIKKRLDSILVDVSPVYTGNQQNDGQYINNIVTDALNFGDTFLKRGGNFVCKMLQCQQQQATNEYLKVAFNEVHRYVPTITRKTSPVFYFVAKGFLMNQSYHAINQFIKKYNNTIEKQKKILLVKSYQKQYIWNPQKVVKNMIKQSIKRMKTQGHTDKSIIYAFSDDPYVNVQDCLRQIKAKSVDKMTTKNVIRKILNLQKSMIRKSTPSNYSKFPDNKQDLYYLMNKDKLKPTQQPIVPKKNRKPLEEGEIYMKNMIENDIHIHTKIYIQKDLSDPGAHIDERQLQISKKSTAEKLIQIYPEFTKDGLFSDLKDDSSKKYKDLSKQIFDIDTEDQQMQKIYRDMMQTKVQRQIRQQNQKSQQDIDIQDEMYQKTQDQKQPYQKDDYIRQTHQRKSDRYVNQKRSLKRPKGHRKT